MRFNAFQGDDLETILYTSILFSDIRCRRLFRRSVVFTVSMSKSRIASSLVLENDLQRRSLGRRVTEDVDRSPQGTNSDRDKCICGVELWIE